jgi:probable HAF family extracellular repeat protein
MRKSVQKGSSQGQSPFGLIAVTLVLGLTSDHANTVKELPNLGGSTSAIRALNDIGRVAGFSILADGYSQHGFLYDGTNMTDLGTLGGTFSLASGVNIIGQVIGDASTANDLEFHAFLFANGGMIDLGTLGGTMSTAMDINSSGQVVGNSFLLGNTESHGFLFSGGQILDLGTLGGSSSGAATINNLGEVVGDSFTTNNMEIHPFLYRNSAMTDLGTLGGWPAFATDINDNGVIVGESGTDLWETHAFAWVGGAMSDLGTLGGDYSTAYAVNEVGQIIGDSTLAGGMEFHAFIHGGGIMTDLGTLGGSYSSAFAINSLGQVVGEATDPSEMTFAFLWENGSMVNLNTLLPPNSGWELWSAQFINDAGMIAGYGLLNGNFSWYLFNLESENSPPVARAGSDQILQCPDTVTLHGSGSSDPNGDTLNYTWSENGVVIAFGVGPTINLSPGVHSIVLTVSDPARASSQDTMVVTIADTTPPVASCPVNSVIEAGADCTAVVPDLTSSVVASDNCAAPTSLLRTQSPVAGTVVGVGDYEVVLTVSDPAGNKAFCVTRLLVMDSIAPVIATCPDAIITDAGEDNKAPVPDFLAHLNALDNCTAPEALVRTQDPAAGTRIQIGIHPITLTVIDSSGNWVECVTSFTVADASSPVVTCPGPVTLMTAADGFARVPDLLGDTVAADNWTPAEDLVKMQYPPAGSLIPSGEHVITVTATDAAGNQGICTSTVIVKEPCRLAINSVTASPDVLLPTNNKMVPVTLTVNYSDSCGLLVESRIVGVTSSDSVTGQGDNTSPDWELTGPVTLNLRAEHSSKADIRVYTITVECQDSEGNRARNTVEVLAPKNRNSLDRATGLKVKGNNKRKR